MFGIKVSETSQRCFIRLIEVFPSYRRMVCGLFDKSEFQFTKTQQMIIMTLWKRENMSLSQLSNRICTSNEQATRAVSQLVKGGYLTRVKNENNRRTIEISLTDKAKAIVNEVQQKALERIPEEFKKLDEQDAATVLECVEKVSRIFEKMMP